MVRRTPAMFDPIGRVRLYAGNYFDPDRYTIWCDGVVLMLIRTPQEATTELYNRVLESIDSRRLLCSDTCHSL
jgi:hypothetical protein